MLELKQTEAFESGACGSRTIAPERSLLRDWIGWLKGILAMQSLLAKASANCAFIKALAIASIFRTREVRSSYCFAVATRAHRRKTSELQNALRRNGVNRMGGKLSAYDPAEDLLSDEAIATFMEEAFKTEDAGYIAHALGVVARAKGMTEIAKETGLSREQLYRSFSASGNPTLKTTIAVMKALGIELTAKSHIQ